MWYLKSTIEVILHIAFLLISIWRIIWWSIKSKLQDLLVSKSMHILILAMSIQPSMSKIMGLTHILQEPTFSSNVRLSLQKIRHQWSLTSRLCNNMKRLAFYKMTYPTFENYQRAHETLVFTKGHTFFPTYPSQLFQP